MGDVITSMNFVMAAELTEQSYFCRPAAIYFSDAGGPRLLTRIRRLIETCWGFVHGNKLIPTKAKYNYRGMPILTRSWAWEWGTVSTLETSIAYRTECNPDLK